MKTLNEKQVKILSIVATIAAVCMYFACIAQIQANLAGQKGIRFNHLPPHQLHIVGDLWLDETAARLPRCHR